MHSNAGDNLQVKAVVEAGALNNVIHQAWWNIENRVRSAMSEIYGYFGVVPGGDDAKEIRNRFLSEDSSLKDPLRLAINRRFVGEKNGLSW
jgi:hypothetical protein